MQPTPTISAPKPSQHRPLLEVDDLVTYFELEEGTVRAVDSVSFRLERGETLGIVGESGCGKSVTALSILNVVPWPGRIVSGKILLHTPDDGVVDLAALSPFGREVRDVRGKQISMIFQEPMEALSPLYTIGYQITEGMLLHHRSWTPQDARARAVTLLRDVGIPSPEKRIDSYTFQLSGGMRQRAMIAMALACNPRLLIADEPTTAVDVTIQAQILELLRKLQRQYGMSMIMISHDLGVIAHLCDRVIVMYLGKVVEEGRFVDVYDDPLHPYTRALLESIPRIGERSRQRLKAIAGAVPDPYTRPAGCYFEPRCEQAQHDRCEVRQPALVTARGRQVRCVLYGNGDHGDG